MDKVMLQLNIGNHLFKVRIAEQDKPAMVAAARHINQMLEQERSHSSVVDGERAAIIVALRCATEMPSGTGASNREAAEDLLDEALAVAQQR